MYAKIGLLIVSSFFMVSAQEKQIKDTSDILEDMQWEKILESIPEGENNSAILEELDGYVQDPLDINTAPPEKIYHIPLMTSLIASRIVERRKQKPFGVIEELNDIEGMTPKMVSFMRKYFKIVKQRQDIDVRGAYTSSMKSEFEQRRGFAKGVYKGTPIKLLNKFQMSIKNIEPPLLSIITDIKVGVLSEKDPGEKSISSFASGFGSISMAPLSANIIFGDYRIVCAEGLVFGNAYVLAKGSEVIKTTRLNGEGIKTSLSSEENFFFRGAAAKLEIYKMQLQLFYSNKHVNASIDSLGRITSIDQSGLFRSENEFSKHNSTREIMLGYRFTLPVYDGLKIGQTGYYSHFTNPLDLNKGSTEAVTRFSLQGLDLSYTEKEIDLFTEAAFNRLGETAVLLGCTYSPLPSFVLSAVARKYPYLFQSVHGNAFGESNSKVQNESGVYVGIRFKPVGRLCISSYYDQFTFSQSLQFASASPHGNDFLILTEYRIWRNNEIAFRFKRKVKQSSTEENDEFGRMTRRAVSIVQDNYRLAGEFESLQSIRLASRIEWTKRSSGLGGGTCRGLLLSQTIKWNYAEIIVLKTRFTFFETDSYDSRIYEFEDDLPYVFSNPPLFNRGMRMYLVINFKYFSNITLSAKYWQMIKNGASTIGTGNDEIKGDKQSYLSFQIDVQF